MNTWIARLLYGLLLAICLPASAVDYALPDLNGRLQSLEQFRGKWVIVNYWATWCGTCRKEFPELISLHKENAHKDIVVVGVNFETISPRELETFVAEQSIPYPVLRSEPIPATPLGPVPALPTTYIIDPKGTLVAGEVGIVTRQEIEDYIAGRHATKVH